MKKNSLLKIFSICAASALTAGIMAITTPSIEASAATPETFEMQSGAYIRLPVGEETEYGIKYTAQIHKNEYVETDKYYVMIIPAVWVQKYELNDNYYERLVEEEKMVWQGENRTINIMESVPKTQGDYYTISGSIVDVKYKNTYREFFGIVYKTDANGANRVYADFEEGENVRSIAQVASAALNDVSYGYTLDQKNDLTALVKNAYNASLGNETATADLPTVSVENVSLALGKDKTYQLNAPETIDGYLETLGLDVDYTTSDKTQATVTDEGLVTVKSVNANATIKALVLGEEHTVADINGVDNILVGFDNENSVNNIITSKNQTYSVDGTACELADQTTWLSEFEGRQGVVQTITTAQPKDAWVTYINVIFDKSKEEIMALDFDYISMWIWFSNKNAYGVRSHNLKMYADNSLQPNAWQEIKITKEQIADSTSYWVAAMGTAVSAIENFANAHGSDRASRESWLSANNLISLRPGKHNCDSTTIYIDSISYGKNEDFNISLGEYTVPTLTGETFTLPTAKMTGGENVLMANDYTVSATCDGTPVSITDNAISLSNAGTYVITYQFTYNGIVYEKQISFALKRAGLVLADFGAADSVSTLRNAQLAASTEANYSTYVASKPDSAGTVKTGVVELALGGTTRQAFFNSVFTAAEMADVEWDYVSIWVLIERTEGTSDAIWQENGCNKYYTNGVWTEIKYTKEEVNSNTTVWGKKAAAGEAATGAECFYKRHSATGNGSYLFLLPTNVVATIYIDSIALVKNPA